MTDIKSLTLAELRAELTNMGEKAYRAGQIFGWLHQKRAAGFFEMSNIPLALRERLKSHYELAAFRDYELLKSSLDETRKYLFTLKDGHRVESVLMSYKYGRVACISSQVGCRMACVYCASADNGFVRSLGAGEMLEQVYAIGRDVDERVPRVVVMGTGEPLDNYEELIKFIHILTDKSGQDVSERHVTVSTCGLVPMIYRLADECLQINLALSLGACDDEKRGRIMPMAKQYPLAAVLTACAYYFQKSGRRISFEYSLIKDVNDAAEDALALKDLALNFKQAAGSPLVNLIALNPLPGKDLSPPPPKKIVDFKNVLEKYQINVTIRSKMGTDICGACGQLRGGSSCGDQG